MLTAEDIDRITSATGLERVTVQALFYIPKYYRRQLMDYINLRINQEKAHMAEAVWDKLRLTTAVSAFQVQVDTLKLTLKPVETLLNDVPWVKYAGVSPQIARLLDLLKGDSGISGKVKKFMGLRTLGGDSYEEVKRRVEELTYKLQRAIDLRTYADQVRSAIDSQINELQRWVNALIMLDGYTVESFTFTGVVYAGGERNVSWTEGNLIVNEYTYAIKAGSINGLLIDVYYLYFDIEGDLTFLVTPDEYTSESGSNIHIAKITVPDVGLSEILFYGVSSQ